MLVVEMNDSLLNALFAKMQELEALITLAAIEGMHDVDGAVLARLLDDAILFARTDDSECDHIQ